MSVSVKVYRVKNLSNVNVTWYKNGDIFITERSVGVLHNGKIKTIGNEQQDLSDYAKKDDIPDVSKFITADDIPAIPDVSKFVTVEDVQAMIDEALQPDPEGE